MTLRLLILLLLLPAVYGQAQQHFIDSLTKVVNNSKKEDTVLLNAMARLSAIYASVNPDKGLEIAGKGFAIAKKIGDPKGSLTMLYMAKFSNYRVKGNIPTAETAITTAIKIAKENNLGIEAMQALLRYGVLKMETGKNEEARQSFKEIIANGYKFENKQAETDATGNLGLLASFEGNYIEALNWLLKAEAMMKTTVQKKLNEINMKANIGLVYLKLKQYEKAKTYFGDALAIAKRENAGMAQVVCLAQLSYIAISKKEYEKALKLAGEAKAIAKGDNNFYGISSVLAHEGIALLEMGQYARAKNVLDTTRVLLKKQNNLLELSLPLIYLAKYYLNAPGSLLQNENLNTATALQKAETLFKESIEINKQTKNIERDIMALEGLAEVNYKKGMYQEAYKYLQSSRQQSDSLFTDEKKLQAGYLEAEFDNQKKTAVIQANHTAQLKQQKTVRNFLLGGTGLVLLSGILLFVSYKRRRDAKAWQLQAQQQAQIADTQMKVLRLQMNPHFIFNSLNSISDYIRKNNTEEADGYLSKFARVMRNTLEHSEHKTIPLADDLKTLELYMQLEAKRLDNKFTYDIKVTDDIDAENTLVPPMILQPFVENSIWHGIAQKQGPGHINIHIAKEHEMLRCVIDDDGIGRIAAGATMQQYQSKKQSLGMKITHARIAMLNQQKNTHADVELKDKEKGSGVKAVLLLPLETIF